MGCKSSNLSDVESPTKKDTSKESLIIYSSQKHQSIQCYGC